MSNIAISLSSILNTLKLTSSPQRRLNLHIYIQPQQLGLYNLAKSAQIPTHMYSRLETQIKNFYLNTSSPKDQIEVKRIGTLIYVGSKQKFGFVQALDHIQIASNNCYNITNHNQQYNSKHSKTSVNRQQKNLSNNYSSKHSKQNYNSINNVNNKVSSIPIKKQQKMCSLSKLEALQDYIQQNRNKNTLSNTKQKVKQIIKFLLVKQMDMQRKIIIYRNEEEIASILQASVRAILSMMWNDGHCILVKLRSWDLSKLRQQQDNPMDKQQTQIQSQTDSEMKIQMQMLYSPQAQKLLQLINPYSHPLNSLSTYSLHYNLSNQQLILPLNKSCLPQAISKLIALKTIGSIFNSYYGKYMQRDNINGVGFGALCRVIKGCGVVRVVMKYAQRLMRQIQSKKNTSLILNYINSIKTYKTYLNISNIVFNKQVQKYLKSVANARIYNKNQHMMTLTKYILSYNKYIGTHEKLKLMKIKKIQSNIRMYLSTKTLEKTEQQQYLSTQMSTYTNNRKQYSKLCQHINKLLRSPPHTKPLNYGLNCHVNIVSIDSWSNCEMLGPEALGHFMDKVLRGRGSSGGIVKILVEGMNLWVVRGDGRMFGIGVGNGGDGLTSINQINRYTSLFRHQEQHALRQNHQSIQQNLKQLIRENTYNKIIKKQKKNIKQLITSDDNSYTLMKDNNNFLYARGQNLYGQLGISDKQNYLDYIHYRYFSQQQQKQKKDYIQNWTKVSLKSKVKLFDCRAKRSICLTVDNQLYVWGAISQQMYVGRPILLTKSSHLQQQMIISIGCSYNGFFVMTQKTQIYQIVACTIRQSSKPTFTWIPQKRILKAQQQKCYQQKFMVITGNSLLEIIYVVGLKIECYDAVRKRNIIRWFRVLYEGTETNMEGSGEGSTEGDNCLIGGQQDLGTGWS